MTVPTDNPLDPAAAEASAKESLKQRFNESFNESFVVGATGVGVAETPASHGAHEPGALCADPCCAPGDTGGVALRSSLAIDTGGEVGPKAITATPKSETFSAFVEAHRSSRPSPRVVGAWCAAGVAHLALLVAGVVNAFWVIDELPPPAVTVSLVRWTQFPSGPPAVEMPEPLSPDGPLSARPKTTQPKPAAPRKAAHAKPALQEQPKTEQPQKEQPKKVAEAAPQPPEPPPAPAQKTEPVVEPVQEVERVEPAVQEPSSAQAAVLDNSGSASPNAVASGGDASSTDLGASGHMGAGPGSGASSAGAAAVIVSDSEKKRLLRAYLDTIFRSNISGKMFYPPEAEEDEIEGVVVVRVVIDASGRLLSAQLVSADDVDVLGRAALQAVRAAQPFPPPPVALGRQVEVQVPMNYFLEG